ncbi:hypothetical protein Q5752_004594 [Cryptotrichosporon argae]
MPPSRRAARAGLSPSAASDDETADEDFAAVPFKRARRAAGTDRGRSGGEGGRAGSGRQLSREQARKANHSIIERRRRDKMNAALDELRAMVPGLRDGGGTTKAGEFKLEVLERTVAHMRELKARLAVHEGMEETPPSRALSPAPLPLPSLTKVSPAPPPTPLAHARMPTRPSPPPAAPNPTLFLPFPTPSPTSPFIPPAAAAAVEPSPFLAPLQSYTLFNGALGTLDPHPPAPASAPDIDVGPEEAANLLLAFSSPDTLRPAQPPIVRRGTLGFDADFSLDTAVGHVRTATHRPAHAASVSASDILNM